MSLLSKILVPPQRDIPERLDLHHGSLAEVRRSLHDIRRINTYLGGTRLSVQGVLLLLPSDKKEATLLDVGSGLGDTGSALISAAARRGVKLSVIGLDINARHLMLARREHPQVLGVRGDAFRLPVGDLGVDIVHSSLFLHHFRAREIQDLLREFSRAARVGWFMNDLARHTLPLWFFRSTWPIFARSPLTRFDGSASVRRAYTKAELERVVAPISGARVRAHIPFRLSVEWRRAQ
jgi:SAM-dependent methyltransferase